MAALGRKIYSTGAPILKWYTVWAKTDEPNVRVGLFLVPAGLPGTRIVETWDHLGLRASGSHDVVFDDVVFPLDHEIDVRTPDEWLAPDFAQAAAHAIFIAAIYDGVARAARDWLVEFLKSRVPSNLGASLATLAAVAGCRRRHRDPACRQCPPDRQLCRRLRPWRCAEPIRIQHHQAHRHQ